MMEQEAIWRLAVDVGQFLLTGVVAVYVYWVKRDQARRETLERLEGTLSGRLDELHTRMTQAEGALSSTVDTSLCAQQSGRVAMLERLIGERPGHDDMKRVHQRIDETSAIASDVRGRLAGIERSLEMITEHLLRTRTGGAP